jgi:archaellum biogenesis ATPase FlaH
LIPTSIIRHLIHNFDYGKKVIPFLCTDYFSGGEQIIFSIINNYVKKYGEFPNLEAVSVDLSNLSISQSKFDEAKDVLVAVQEPQDDTSLDWLLDSTEKYCQEKAISNAILSCIKVQNGEEKKYTKGDFPRILSDALAISFETNLGHDFFENAEDQFNYYHDDRKRLSWGIEKFNSVTRGGLLSKTLNIFMASTGVGKSLIMSSCAASHLAMGKTVLYFTMEMSEKMIRQRMDANLLNIDIDQLEGVDRERYFNAIERVKKKTSGGHLIVKEYESGSANIDHFNHFLHELRIKKKIVPDVVYVDYLNICSSNRLKSDSGSYGYIKSITQEIRSLAQRHDIPIISATQTNRGGYENNDIGLGDISDSFGTSQEVDLLWGVMQPSELEPLGQYKIKQLKSRYDDPNKMKEFLIGVDKQKMRIYNLESKAEFHRERDDARIGAGQAKLITSNVFEDWK